MVTIKAQKRTTFGRKNHLLRKEGFVPVILYGEGLQPQPLQVKAEDLTKAYQEVGDTGLVSVAVQGEKGENSQTYSCLIYDMQHDPVTDAVIHADFYHPSMRKKVTAEVPLSFEGVAPAVKEKGGVLVKDKMSVEVRGLAADLPKEIKVDLGGLKEIHDKILVQDLPIGKKLEILDNPEEIVASVTMVEAVEEELEKPIEAEEAKVEGAEATKEENKEEEKKEEKKEKDKKEEPSR